MSHYKRQEWTRPMHVGRVRRIQDTLQAFILFSRLFGLQNRSRTTASHFCDAERVDDRGSKCIFELTGESAVSRTATCSDKTRFYFLIVVPGQSNHCVSCLQLPAQAPEKLSQALSSGSLRLQWCVRDRSLPIWQLNSRDRMAWRSALSRNLQELRISLSQTSPGSQVSRTFG